MNAPARRFRLLLVLLALASLLPLHRGHAQEAPTWLSRDRLLRFQPRTAQEAIEQLRSLTSEQGALWVESASPRFATSETTDGRWREMAPPSRSGHSLLHDARRDRMLAVGSDGFSRGTTVWALRRDPADRWELVGGAGLDSVRGPFTATLDSLEDRLIGYRAWWEAGAMTAELDELRLNETEPTWSTLAGPSGLPAAANALLACDDAGRRLFLVGKPSYDSVAVWSAALHPDSAWRRIFAEAIGWGAPAYSSLLYHPGGDALYLMGESGDVHELVLSPHPSWARSFHPGHVNGCTSTFKMALRAATNEILAVDGPENVSAYDLTASSWRRLVGTDPSLTCVRDHFAASYDPIRDQLLVHGGWSRRDFDTRSDTRMLDLAAPTSWQTIAQSSGGARMWHRAAIDTRRDRMVVYGGWGSFAILDTLVVRPLADADASASPLHPSGPRPRPRFGHSLTYDPAGDRMIVYGGQATDGTGDYLDDLWELSMSEPVTWSRLHPIGDAPGVRRFHGMFRDAAGERMILVGGDDGIGYPEGAWELTLGPTPQWTRLNATGAPLSGGSGAWFDPIAREVWMLSDGELKRGALGDSALEVEAVAIANGPLPSGFGVRALDPIRRRLVGFLSPQAPGGMDPLHRMVVLHLTNPAEWEYVPIGAAPPLRRYLESAVLDSARDRLILYGGYDDFERYLDETWALDWSADTPVPTAVVSATVQRGLARLEWRLEHAISARVQRQDEGQPWATLAAVRSDANGSIVWLDAGVVPGGRYRYRLAVIVSGVERYAGEVAVSIPATRTLELRAAGANPTAGDVDVIVSLPTAGIATLEMFDLAGRHVAERRLSNPGAQRLRLAPRGTLAAGLYLIRLRQGNEERVLKSVIAR